MSLAGLSLRDLEYLVAVADCRHFGRAAKRCRVSQPALSAQVRKPEGYLGARIFERSRNGVLITKPGAALVERARMVLTEANTLLAVARDSTAPLAGPFRLGSIPTVGPYFLPHLLKMFRHSFPSTRLVLSEKRTHELLALLRGGELDAVIACAPVHDDLLAVHQLFFEPFVLAHPPGRSPAWPPTPAGPDEFVLLEEGHCLRDQTLAVCGPMLPRAKRHATGLEMLRHMVAAGEGLSLMPALAAAALGPIDGLVTYTPIPAEYAGRHVIMLVRTSDPRGLHLGQVAQLARECVPPPAVAA